MDKMMQTAFSIVLVVFIQATLAINSYIYLPDRKVQEELPVGTLLIDLNEELSSKNLNRSSYIEQYTFLDDTKANSTNMYFLVDIVTGRITTKRYIDRESMCLNRHCLNPCDVSSGQQQQFAFSCKMNLKILLMPLSNILSVNIFIEDINDNRPKWRKDFLNHSIYENVQLGYKIPIDLAYDADVGEHSIKAYKISEQFDGTFELEHNANELGLIVRKKLDRELKSFYNFSVIAFDGGRPTSNTGQLQINLHILDINDNNPIFDKDLYRFKIREDTEPDTLIGHVHATDLDDGINGQITYLISSTHNVMGEIIPKKSVKFYLNATSGQMFLRNKLDYEDESQINVAIEARDLNGEDMKLSLASYCTVEIVVLDCNDNEPEISVSFDRGVLMNQNNVTTDPNQIYLKEHIDPNKFIAHVSITDADSGDNGRIGWTIFINHEEMDPVSMPDGIILKTQKLNGYSFIMSTGKYSGQLMDRELTSHLNVSIVAWDYGMPQLRASFNFTINLIDINDHKPEFNQKFYNLTITENNEIDSFVYKFDVIDLDLKENSKIKFSLRSFNSNSTLPFRIEDQGYLYANEVFDREIKDVYKFYVIASDSGLDKQLNASVLVQVNINDLNDNEPVITYANKNDFIKNYMHENNTIILEINENLNENTEIVKFTSVDIDSTPNSRSSFYLKDRLQQKHFLVNSNGSLILVNKLDAETNRLVKFEIICENFANKPATQRSIITVVVQIVDVNDNCPIEASSTAKTKFLLKNVLDAKDSLFELNFTDHDVNPNTNSKLKFQLLSHTNLFEIHQNRIYFQRRIYEIRIGFRRHVNMTLIKPGKYDIKLKVSDHGEPLPCDYQHLLHLFVGDSDMNLSSIDDIEYRIKYLTETTGNIYQHDNNDDNGQSTTPIQVILMKKIKIPNKMSFKYLIVLLVIFAITIILITVSCFLTVYFFNKKQKIRNIKKPLADEQQPNDHQSSCDLNSCDLNSYTSSSLTKDTKLNSICSNSSVDHGLVTSATIQPTAQLLTSSTYLMKLTDRIKMQQHYNNLNLKSFVNYNRCDCDETNCDENETEQFLPITKPYLTTYKGYYSSDV